MKNTDRRFEKKLFMFFAAAVCAVALAFSTIGCSPSKPEEAAKKFFDSISDHNWYGYLGSILPANVRELTDTEMIQLRESFDAADQKLLDLKMNVEYDKKGKGKAKVTITGGKLAYKTQEGKDETITIEEFTKQTGSPITLDAKKFKDRWYVDIPLKGIEEEAR